MRWGALALAAARGGSTSGQTPESALSLHRCISWSTHELARCGTLRVLENSATPDGRQIALRVMILPARTSIKHSTPLVFLNGGPGLSSAWAKVLAPPSVQNAAGLQLLIAPENHDPTLRVVLPGHATSDRSIEVLFPEHVTAVQQGSTRAEQLYLFRPGQQGERPAWRRVGQSLEYQRDLAGSIHLLARATLEDDGVRFRYEFTNGSRVAYDMIYAVTDPRLGGIFHDERLERTYVHHPDGFDLLASEVPGRLTMSRDRWLPARVLVASTWPVPAERVEDRGDGITYYNKSRAVDVPFIATLSADSSWIVASFAREAGNVWSNPELTCQHVDPQASLQPGQHVTREVKILVMRGTLDDALRHALRQREALK